MVDGAQFRLICYEGHSAKERCVFDATAEKKQCESPELQVRVKHSNSEPPVSFRSPDTHVRHLPFPDPPTPDRPCPFGTRPIPTVYFKRRRDRVEDLCRLTRVNSEDDRSLISWGERYPPLWNLLRTRLDELLEDDYGAATFRERARQMLCRDRYNDERNFYNLLSEVAANLCFPQHRKMIPYLPGVPIPVPPTSRRFPPGLRQCYTDEATHRPLEEYAVHLDVQQDRNCFWNTLAQFVPQTTYRPPSGRPTEILDIGCGTASGALSLVEYFRGVEQFSFFFGWHNSVVHYTGVDPDEKALMNAEAINPRAFDFVQEDTGRFFASRKLENAYDVILFRHPGPFHTDWHRDTGVWAELMKTALDRLSEDGIMIITNYECYEYRTVQYLFAEVLDAHIYMAGINPFSFHAGFLDRDYYVTIIGKTGSSSK